METRLHYQIGETWPRFLCHWIASCFGHFFKVLLPIVINVSDKLQPEAFPRWWSVALFAGCTSLLSAVINANLPVTARELVKSMGFGFALSATATIVIPGWTG
jgi:hypothetical protein